MIGAVTVTGPPPVLVIAGLTPANARSMPATPTRPVPVLLNVIALSVNRPMSLIDVYATSPAALKMSWVVSADGGTGPAPPFQLAALLQTSLALLVQVLW